MEGDKPISVAPLRVTGCHGPTLILGWMNNKHYLHQALGGVGGSANVETTQARAAASQRGTPGDAISGDPLPSYLQCLGGHESQQLEAEKAREADAAPMTVQALDHGSWSDAGRDPASTALGPADGPDRAAAPAAATANAAAHEEAARMAQEAARAPAAEDVSRFFLPSTNL